MTDYQAFSLERQDRVSWVVLNNPANRNAMGTDFWREIEPVFQEADADPESRVIVLAAEGKSFSAGLNIPEMAPQIPALLNGEPGGQAKQDLLGTIRDWQRKIAAPEACKKPVLAAIHGYCIGGGINLVSACDIRLASRDAQFNLKEAALAMVCDLGALQRLPTIIGEGCTRELAFLADFIDAERALQMNLVNRLYEDKDALWAAAQDMAQRIAANSPLAIRITKEVLNRGRDQSQAEGLEYVAARQSALLPHADLMEAMAAFMERRKPVY